MNKLEKVVAANLEEEFKDRSLGIKKFLKDMGNVCGWWGTMDGLDFRFTGCDAEDAAILKLGVRAKKLEKELKKAIKDRDDYPLKAHKKLHPKPLADCFECE